MNMSQLRTSLSADNNYLEMYWLTRPFIWLSRIGHCRGFGIQSPSDYWLVRYVINEHWPYYQYDHLGQDDDTLRRKLGQLYFRIANWRQPTTILSDDYQNYFKAGCRMAEFCDDSRPLQLARLAMEGGYRKHMANIYNKVDSRSVLIVEGIHRDKPFWRQLIADERTGVTFDLYYCGLVLFDKGRHKRNYIINF